MKRRMCANQAPHRKFVPREEEKLPEITLEGILGTMVVGSYEYRKVENFDLPRAYLQTDLPKDKFILLLMEDKFVDIMCDINMEYK